MLFDSIHNVGGLQEGHSVTRPQRGKMSLTTMREHSNKQSNSSVQRSDKKNKRRDEDEKVDNDSGKSSHTVGKANPSKQPSNASVQRSDKKGKSSKEKKRDALARPSMSQVTVEVQGEHELLEGGDTVEQVDDIEGKGDDTAVPQVSDSSLACNIGNCMYRSPRKYSKCH